MSGLPELYHARTALDVPWDRAREKRVLDGALESWRGRARRMRALEISGALLTIALLVRVSVRSSATSDDVESAVAVPEAQREPSPAGQPAMTHVGDATKRANSATSGGVAGTGGHGGGGSTGLGGSAGTG